MHGSIAEGFAAPSEAPSTLAGRVPQLLVGAILTLSAILLYIVSNQERHNFYDHFVWQADAFLHGRFAIPYPVPENEYFQDVYPISTTEALLPFPPLPALVLLPFVALFGFDTDQELLAAVLSGFGVGLAYWMLGKLPVGLAARVLATVFFGAGTVFWWTASVGTTWYFAHVVAVDLALVAVGLALGSDRDAAFDQVWDDEAPSHGASFSRVRSFLAATLPLDGRQMLIGLLFGLAATARLPVILGAPFFMLVGAGDTWQRRSLSAGFGALIPVLGLLTYNVASTGSLFHPAYEWQYQREAQGYTALGYHPEWSIEDVRYIPQNLGIMFGSLPDVLPDARTYALGPDFLPDEPVCVNPGSTRGLFDPECPLALPRDIGTSLLVSSPAYLLLLWPLRRWGRSRLVTGGIVAVVLIALLNLAHFSQGWVQWGYRFSNDLVPFALPLIALGAAGHHGRVRLVAFTLVVLSVLINVWGVIWGNLLGW